MTTPDQRARATGANVIPLEQIHGLEYEPAWERRRTARGLPTGDLTTLARTGESLDQFSATLAPHERAALAAIVNVATGETPFAALRAEPVETVLEPRERDYYARLVAETPPAEGRLRPAMNVIMKATRLCNLRCTYCHYWREGPNMTMGFPVMARTIRDVLRDPSVRSVEFIWHGGETTLMPIAFYHKALWLQQQFARPDQTVRNRIQTNATRLTDEWLAFWKRYQFIVGTSLDGPPEVHDTRRMDVGGHPTAAKVREGLARMRAAGLDPRVLMVVDEDIIALGAKWVLEYLLEADVRRVGVLNVVPATTEVGAPQTGNYLPWPRYTTFLRDLFYEWWPQHVNTILIRELMDLIGQLTGKPPLICNFAGDCFGGIYTIEPGGDISACDRFVDDPEYRFGNVLKMNLSDLAASPRLATIRAANEEAVERTRACAWFSICHGGCPHDRGLGLERVPGFNEGCCGLAPLLEELAGTLRSTGLPVHGGVPAAARS